MSWASSFTIRSVFMTPTGGEKFPALAVGFAEQPGKAALRFIFASDGGPVKSL